MSDSITPDDSEYRAAVAFFMANHHAHDSHQVLERARRLAESIEHARWEVLVAEKDGMPEVGAIVLSGHANRPAFYLSAGVHGDEPAGVLGALSWAESALAGWQMGDVVYLPLVNPWGLEHNVRNDASDQDLNRLFGDHDHPLIKAWRRMMDGRQFAASVSLHEDYDACGCYCYEIFCDGALRLARGALDAAADVIPLESCDEIEGVRAENGLLARAGLPDLADGVPEAFPLFSDYATTSLTFETPSEYSLYDRARAHERFLHHVVGRLRRM